MTRGRLALVVMSAAVLASCAPTIVGGNERGGDIEHVIGLTKADAFRKAEEHCKKYGRVARVSQYDVLGSSLTFDCVER